MEKHHRVPGKTVEGLKITQQSPFESKQCCEAVCVSAIRAPDRQLGGFSVIFPKENTHQGGPLNICSA